MRGRMMVVVQVVVLGAIVRPQVQAEAAQPQRPNNLLFLVLPIRLQWEQEARVVPALKVMEQVVVTQSYLPLLQPEAVAVVI